MRPRTGRGWSVTSGTGCGRERQVRRFVTQFRLTAVSCSGGLPVECSRFWPTHDARLGALGHCLKPAARRRGSGGGRGLLEVGLEEEVRGRPLFSFGQVDWPALFHATLTSSRAWAF